MVVISSRMDSRQDGSRPTMAMPRRPADAARPAARWPWRAPRPPCRWQVGAAAAQVLAVGRLLAGDVHRVARRLQHLERRLRVGRFEEAVEGVHEQHHGPGRGQQFSRVAPVTPLLKKWRLCHSGSCAGPRSPGCVRPARPAGRCLLRRFSRPAKRLAWPRSPAAWRPAGPSATSRSSAVGMAELDLHARHVHAGGAVALAALAAHAEVQRLAHRIARQAVGPSWPLTASRSVLARPRVRCCSSRVTR